MLSYSIYTVTQFLKLFTPPVSTRLTLAVRLSTSLSDQVRHPIGKMPVRETIDFTLLLLLAGCEKSPKLANPDPLHRQHAVLQAIQILSMNRRDELAGDQTQEDSR